MATIYQILILLFSLFLDVSSSLEIMSKTKLQKCVKMSGYSKDSLHCNHKIVVDLAIPSESSGREASMVTEIVEVEDNSSDNMRTLGVPLIITVDKSAAYAFYHLSYIRDVAYKPVEFHVETRKCEPDAGADTV